MQRPWIPLYIGDYLRDTAHLDATCHGAYLLLLFFCWCKSSAPDDDEQLSAIARCSLKEWTERVGPVVRPFFRVEDGRLYQGRLDREAKKSSDISEKRRKAAMSRKTKAGRRKTAKAEASEQQKQQTISKSSANNQQNPVTEPPPGEQQLHVQPQPHLDKKDREEIPPIVPQAAPADAAAGSPSADPGPVQPAKATRKRQARPEFTPELRADFERWWSDYPVVRQVKQGSAEVAYLHARRTATAEELLAGLWRHQFSNEKRFMPHPASWLNAKSWLDNPAAHEPEPGPADHIRDFVHGVRERSRDTPPVDSAHYDVAPESPALLRIPGDD